MNTNLATKFRKDPLDHEPLRSSISSRLRMTLSWYVVYALVHFGAMGLFYDGFKSIKQ